jgi:hypothetical protein
MSPACALPATQADGEKNVSRTSLPHCLHGLLRRESQMTGVPASAGLLPMICIRRHYASPVAGWRCDR